MFAVPGTLVNFKWTLSNIVVSYAPIIGRCRSCNRLCSKIILKLGQLAGGETANSRSRHSQSFHKPENHRQKRESMSQEGV